MGTSLLKDYLKRFIKHYWWWIGFLILSVFELVDVVLPWVTGLPWFLLVAAAVVGVFGSGYMVFLDVVRENAKALSLKNEQIASLEKQIREIAETRPRIRVEFEGSLGQELEIAMAPAPPVPDYDAIVKEKRKELLSRTIPRTHMLDYFNKPNPKYAQEVDEYLPRYKEFIRQAFVLGYARDRLVSLRPIVINEGSVVASDMTLEFRLPVEIEILDESLESMLEDPEIELWEPKEPNTVIATFDYQSHFYESLGDVSIGSLVDRTWDRSPSELRGPEFDESHRRVTYQIRRLAPKNMVRELEPFPVSLMGIQTTGNYESKSVFSPLTSQSHWNSPYGLSYAFRTARLRHDWNHRFG